MNREQLQAAMQQETVKATAASFQFQGTRQQFDAACMMGDGVTADALRANLHAYLDLMLDASSTTMMLSRQMMESREE